MHRLISFLLLAAGIGGLLGAGHLAYEQVNGLGSPIPVDLSTLERGVCKRGQPVAFKGALVASAMAFAPTPVPPLFGQLPEDAQPECLFYPVISENHSEYRALSTTAHRYGSFAGIPNNEAYRFRTFSVIVRDFSRRSSHDLPKGLSLMDVERGFFVGSLDRLSSNEMSQLYGEYPGMNPNNVFIVDIEPESSSVLYMLICLSVSALAFFLIIAGARFTPTPEEPPRYNGLGIRNPLMRGDE